MSYYRTALTPVIDVSIRDDLTHQDEDAALRHVIMAFDGLHAEHGLLSDEFSDL